MPTRSGPHRRRRALLLICVTTAGWAFSFGLVAPLASRQLDAEGWCDSVIGANLGVYYLGMALGSLAVPRLMRRWGPRCTAAGMLLAGVTAAILPAWGALPWWFALRFVNGLAGAMSVIPLETYVNRDAAPDQRARDFGCYAVALTLGYALGNFVGLQLYADIPRAAFLIGGCVAAISGLAVWRGLTDRDEPAEEHGWAALEVRRNLLSYGSAWNQGFLEGGMVAFLVLYLHELGLDDGAAGWLTSLAVVGVLLFQIPVAWLADRLGRTPVLLGCYVATLAGLAALPWCGPSFWLAFWLFIVGAASGAFYPLGLALLGERLPPGSLARANACYLAVECVGCIFGPVVMGLGRDLFGTRAMFGVGVVLLAGFLVVWLIARPRGAAHATGDTMTERPLAA